MLDARLGWDRSLGLEAAILREQRLVNTAADNDIDRRMMMRCITLSRESGKAGEYPYGAVVCRNGSVVAESINRVPRDGDVTRHAEVVAISSAQRALGIIERRGQLGSASPITTDVIQTCPTQPPGLRSKALSFLRRNLFDYFSRR